MASPETKKLMEARRLTRISRVKIVRPAEPGMNRTDRRKAVKSVRLKPKMGAERRALIIKVKGPKKRMPAVSKKATFNRRSS